MENNWVKISSYTNAIESEIVKQMLVENGIEAVVLNKQDSSYLLFGKIELYVPQDCVQHATALIQAADSNPEHTENAD